MRRRRSAVQQGACISVEKGEPAEPACPVVRSRGQYNGVGYSPVFIHVSHNGKVGLELITVKRDVELLIQSKPVLVEDFECTMHFNSLCSV